MLDLVYMMLLTAGFFFFRASVRKGDALGSEYEGGVFLRSGAVFVCNLCAALGAAVFLRGAYHFAFVANRAWPLVGYPFSTGTLVLVGEVLAGCLLLRYWNPSLNQDEESSPDDDMSPWPEQAGP